MNRLTASALVLATLAAAPAQAHVVLAPGEATPGAYYVGKFRVSHGCDGSPTVALTVTIPAGVMVAKPQPKPGWTLEIAREASPAPIKGEGGQLIRERVTSVTWRGRLADDQFDEFGLMAKLPETPGALYFPAVQTCERGEARWVETPLAGQRLSHPAPRLTIAPNGQDDAMPGMDMHQHN